MVCRDGIRCSVTGCTLEFPRLIDCYINWLLRWHKPIVVVSVVATLALGFCVSRLTFTNELRAYFSEDNPQLAAFDALEATYDKQETLNFVVVAKNADLFNDNTLTLVWELTELGWQAPYSNRVSSIANYQHTTGTGDELVVEPLIAHPDALTQSAITRIREVVLNEPSLAGALISANGKATLVLIALTLPQTSWMPAMRCPVGRKSECLRFERVFRR